MTDGNDNTGADSGLSAAAGYPSVVDSNGNAIKIGDVLHKHKAFLRVKSRGGISFRCEMLGHEEPWVLFFSVAHETTKINFNGRGSEATWEIVKRMPAEDKESFHQDMAFLSDTTEANR